MDINEQFPSNFLKAEDLKGHSVPVVMQAIEIQDVGDDNKPVLYFRGKEKGLVLNKTNSQTIQDIYGPETNNWMGHPIVIFGTQTDFQGKQVACIRVQINPPAQATAHGQPVQQTYVPDPGQAPPVEQAPPADAFLKNPPAQQPLPGAQGDQDTPF